MLRRIKVRGIVNNEYDSKQKMNLKLLSRYRRAFFSYWFGKIDLKHPPLFYSIEITNNCNYSCRYCPQGNPDNHSPKKGKMDLDLFEDILKNVSKLKPVAQIYLTGSGEPLLHPELEKFITRSNQYGFIPSFSSNGSLFTQERIVSLLHSGKFSLTVDFSPDKETYETYRTGGNWEKVYNNLKSLLHAKKETGTYYPKIEIRDMSTIALSSLEEKERSLADLKKMFDDLPVNRFSQLKVHRWTGNIDQSIALSSVKGNKYKLCTHPWSIFVITWSGDVIPCCRDFGSEYVFGKINGTDDLLKIWNNGKIRSLRKSLAEKKPQEINICKDCDRPWTGGSVGRSKPQMIKRILWEKVISN
ncbi:MAG TPA: radical SAM protein [candidate division Zixibacteria bacterium]